MRGEPEGDSSPNPNHPFQRLFHEPDENGIRRPKRPVFILPSSSRSQSGNDKRLGTDSHRNWLTSVAMITHGFDRMEDYGRYLQRAHDGEAVENRLTQVSDRPEIAENRGDCHVDDDGNVRYPPDNHQHGDDSGESRCGCSSFSEDPDPHNHIDNSEHHVKCVSEPEYWLGWTEPTFAIKPEDEFNVGSSAPEGIDNILSRFETVSEGR